MARSPREKQREREVFEAFLTVRQGRIENQSFAKSFVVSTFTAQKKGLLQNLKKRRATAFFYCLSGKLVV
jgi:NAD-specific glutamate dehydrogenase